MLFLIVFLLVITQRVVELLVAKQNEKWMLEQGAFEVGARHYPFMVMMHIAFFLLLLLEVSVRQAALSPFWQIFLTLFLVAQIGRIWCLCTLGKFWNTKILILPDAPVIRKGPYRFLRHPNYVIVMMELLTLPLLFNAYITAFLFFLLNCWMLSVRIPIEEQALKKATDYATQFSVKL